MQDANLLQLLRDCYTPAGRNIVDASLVRSATLTPDAEAPRFTTRYLATIALYAPGSDDTINAQLQAQIENRLLGVEAISRVHIQLLPALFPIL